MALRAVLDKEKYDGLSDGVKEHYTERDGKFFLGVTKVDGLGVEDIGGLKTTVENLRTVEKNLRTEAKTAADVLKISEDKVKEIQDKFKGIDPDAAKDALSKIEDIKNWDGEKKVKEAVLVAEQRTEQRMQSKLDDVVKQHSEVVKQNTAKVDGLQTDLADSQEQLQEAIVTSKIVEAISKENGNVNVLMPHVRNQVRMAKDSHGKFKPEVVKADGTPRIGDSAGNDMTITQLVQEMKDQDTFAGCFSGANQSGSGKTGSSDSGKQQKTGEGKVVAASDTQGMSDNLEDISTGKTKVDMSQ